MARPNIFHGLTPPAGPRGSALVRWRSLLKLLSAMTSRGVQVDGSSGREVFGGIHLDTGPAVTRNEVSHPMRVVAVESGYTVTPSPDMPCRYGGVLLSNDPAPVIPPPIADSLLVVIFQIASRSGIAQSNHGYWSADVQVNDSTYPAVDYLAGQPAFNEFTRVLTYGAGNIPIQTASPPPASPYSTPAATFTGGRLAVPIAYITAGGGVFQMMFSSLSNVFAWGRGFKI